jgi:hypothetical protein
MIIDDEFLKEFSTDENFADGFHVEHDKCGAKSPEDLNLYGMLKWAQNHRYACPEAEVESITAASVGDRHVVVYLDGRGRTVVETRKGSEVLQTVVRNLVVPKEAEKK